VKKGRRRKRIWTKRKGRINVIKRKGKQKCRRKKLRIGGEAEKREEEKEKDEGNNEDGERREE
jgi:hypothetical protein